MTLTTRWILAGLRRNLIPALLGLYLAGKLLAALIAGDAPQPQIPPDGYVVQTADVRLTWRGRSRGPYRLQVVAEGGDFDEPLVDRKVQSSTFTLHDLDRGLGYRWRVIQENSGRTSTEAGFRTSAHRIVF